MRIGIDARFFGIQQRGIGRYVQRLVESLELLTTNNSQLTKEFEFFVLLRKENWDEYQPKNKNFKKVLAPWRWYSFGEQIFLPRLLKKLNLDLVHFPHFNIPIFYRGKFIVTLHDLQMYAGPGNRVTTKKIFYGFKYKMMDIVNRAAIKRSKYIIGPSNYTKKQIENFFPGFDKKIKIIYEGSDLFNVISSPDLVGINSVDRSLPRRQAGHPVNIAPGEISPLPLVGRDDNILERYGIKKPYIFYVGAAYPHKNLENLIKAFDIIRNKYKWAGQLVLGGKIDYFYKRIQKEFGLDKRQDILLTDFISDQDLPKIFSRAEIYVQASLDEGFGLTPLESLAQGTPAAVSNQGAMPEILGKSALYFNPDNPEDMAKVIYSLITSKELQKSLLAESKEQLKKYSWEKMGRQTLELYSRNVNDSLS